jgi:hypothetical protein
MQAGQRIRNNCSSARYAPATNRGKPRGEWVEARAQILDAEGSEHAHELLDKVWVDKEDWGSLQQAFRTRTRNDRDEVV